MVFRHPEVRAKRASKDERPGPSPFEGPATLRTATSGRRCADRASCHHVLVGGFGKRGFQKTPPRPSLKTTKPQGLSRIRSYQPRGGSLGEPHPHSSHRRRAPPAMRQVENYSAGLETDCLCVWFDPVRPISWSIQRRWCSLAQLTSTLPLPLASKAPSIPLVPL